LSQCGVGSKRKRQLVCSSSHSTYIFVLFFNAAVSSVLYFCILNYFAVWTFGCVIIAKNGKIDQDSIAVAVTLILFTMAVALHSSVCSVLKLRSVTLLIKFQPTF